MRALVTGGAGFIGSNLVDRLLAEGHHVDVVDDLSTGSLANLADARRALEGRLTFHQLDIRASDLPDLMQRCRPEVVFHLAAAADEGDLVRHADVNIGGSLRVLEAARDSGVDKVVYASSGETIPGSPFGVADKAVADYLLSYRELHNLEFTALALAHVYGPRQSSTGVDTLVATFAAHLLAGEACTIYGDGSNTRDFVYIDDVVDAFSRAAARGGGLVLNIGTGRQTSVRDLYQTMASQVGVDVPAVMVSAWAGEMPRGAADPARAAIHLGWKPWTTLAEGTAAVIRFFSEKGLPRKA